MKISNNDPRVIQRSEPKPNVPCSLLNSTEVDCDICRLKSGMTYEGVVYSCVAHLIEARFKQEMLERKKNIQVLWANNYLIEAKREKADNDEGCEASGDIVRSETGQGDTVGEHGNVPVPCSREEIATEDAVGQVYGGE